jgi:hypothetical protein
MSFCPSARNNNAHTTYFFNNYLGLLLKFAEENSFLNEKTGSLYDGLGIFMIYHLNLPKFKNVSHAVLFEINTQILCQNYHHHHPSPVRP